MNPETRPAAAAAPKVVVAIPERSWDALREGKQGFRAVAKIAAALGLFGAVQAASGGTAFAAALFSMMAVLIFVLVIMNASLGELACPACGHPFLTVSSGRTYALTAACPHCGTALGARAPAPGAMRFPFAAFAHARGFRIDGDGGMEGEVRGMKARVARVRGWVSRLALVVDGGQLSDAALADLSERLKATLPGARCERDGAQVRVVCDEEGVEVAQLQEAIEGMAAACAQGKRGAYR